MHSYIEDHTGSFADSHEYTLPSCAYCGGRKRKTSDNCVVNSRISPGYVLDRHILAAVQ